jgi:hypothetical protein
MPIASPAGTTLPKATLTVVDGVGVAPFLTFGFNPSQYSVNKSARWERPRSRGSESSSPPEFTGTDPTRISMEIFFDAFEAPVADVSPDVMVLLSWLQPTPVSMARGLAQPPLLRFVWGANPVLQTFQGYLKSVKAKYTMFLPDGTPIRATAAIVLEEVTPEVGPQNPSSGSREGRRAHVVREGESLQSIAYEEYGEAAYWRGLAAFNAVDDPMRLPAGTELLIPTTAEAARLTEDPA